MESRLRCNPDVLDGAPLGCVVQRSDVGSRELLDFAPMEFKRTFGYIAISSDSEKGADNTPYSEYSTITHCKYSSLPTESLELPRNCRRSP